METSAPIDYLIDAAYLLGFSSKPKKGCTATEPSGLRDPDWQAGYSLAWYFEDLLARDLRGAVAEDGSTESPLAAYLGVGRIAPAPDPASYAEEAALEDELLDERFPQESYPLNEKQREAVHKALHNPVSIIKGPPGTGKTEVIMHIVALALARGETVAVVSSNNEAVRTVEEKCEEAWRGGMEKGRPAPGTDLAFDAATKLARLGSSLARKTAAPLGSDEPFGFKAGKGGWEEKIAFSGFTSGEDGHPFVTSTVHSLKKCFADGRDARFDLLIMDEASQTNVLVGIVAMSCARRVVVVGDEEQLAPVVKDSYDGALAALSKRHGLLVKGQGHLDLARHGFSFLESCYEVFDEGYAERSALAGRDFEGPLVRDSNVITTLNEHYRCHPKIIGFCNQEVYGGVLKLLGSHKGGPSFPLAVRWYEGDYRESSWILSSARGKERTAVGAGAALHSSSSNEKQLTVFREEELPYLRERLKADPGLSVCLLTPFRSQVSWLEGLVRDGLGDLLERDAVGREDLVDGSREASGSADEPASVPSRTPSVTALTIHKSQGKGFDIVYLLPVEDGNWEWPWSQGRRLINVAVSRAKRELRVLASTKLMSEVLQERLTGRVAPAKNAASEEDDPRHVELFVRRLADYVALGAPVDPEGPFGLIGTSARSLFDELPFYQNPDAKNGDPSAPERLVGEALGKIAEEYGLRLEREVGLERVCLPDGRPVSHAEDGEKSPMRFDFALVDDASRVAMFVEADGGNHRFAANRSSAAGDDRVTTVFLNKVAGTQGKAAAMGRVVNTSQIKSDMTKDGIVAERLGGVVAHLGRDSTATERREFLSAARRGCLDEGDPRRTDASFDPFSRDVWDVSGARDATGPVLLRIPSDGSTFLETRELRARVGEGALEALPRPLPPTVEDYLEACLAAMKDPDYRPVTVKGMPEPKKPAAPEPDPASVSLSKLLRQLSEDPKKRGLVGKLRAQDVQPALVERGLLKRVTRGDGRSGYDPTEKGAAAGISLAHVEGRGTWPVYAPASWPLVEEVLGELNGVR